MRNTTKNTITDFPADHMETIAKLLIDSFNIEKKQILVS